MASRDVNVGPATLRAGDVGNVMIHVMHRSRQPWDDPATFDPNRFLDSRAQHMNKFQYLPFVAGPRICIGMRLAMPEGALILAALVRRLRFDSYTDYTPMPVLHMTLRPHGGMPLRVRPR